MNRIFRPLMLCCLLIGLCQLAVLPGCKSLSPEQRQSALDQNAASTQIVTTATADSQAKLDAAIAAGDQATAAKLKQEIKAYEVTLAALKAEKAGLENPTPGAGIGTFIMTLGGILPPPFGALATLAGLGWQSFNAYQNKAAAVSLVKQTDVLRDADPSVPSIMAGNKIALNAALTGRAKTIVEKNRRKAT